MSKPSWLNNNFLITLVWFAAIALRLYGATTPAQYYDMGTFEAWSRSFWTYGPRAFFNSVWSDYLPLPILTFAPISLLADFSHAPFGLVFKLIHSFIELILIFFISKISTKSYILNPLSYLLLLSPAFIGDTSFWGQVDTIPALLGLISLTQILNPKSYLLSPGILFGLAVAYKPIMILVAPILWIVDIKKGHWLRFPLISSLIFLVSGIPTGGINFFSHLLSRAVEQSATYPFLTINAFNLWSVVPNMSWIPDSTSVLGISGRAFGFFAFAALSFTTLNNWRKTGFAALYVHKVAAIILITFFTFTTRMHERHLLFGLPFLALAISSEAWLLIPYVLYSLFFALNLYGAYYWVNHAQVWPFGPDVISLISWGITLITLALATIWSWPEFVKTCLLKLKTNKLLITILVIAILLRFINLSHPPAYIFDEVYHAFTARQYLHNHIEAWEWWPTPPEGVAYEWTHPPLAKYGMVVGMLLLGENSLGWRLGSAIFGVLGIMGLYFFISALMHRKDIALIAAFLVSIEGLHIAQSRLAMNDVYMLCFYIWSLYAAVKSRWKPASILYGLALASKWSALYGIIPLAFIYFYQYKPTLYYLLYAVRCTLIALALYILTFAPFILAGHTWAQWWELHRQMWYYHTHLVASHSYESTPLQWLFAVRPVWYWVSYGQGVISNIYAQSNPLILWLGLVALVLQLKKLKSFPYALSYMLYAIFTLPWIFSPRIMFFYHYLPSSVFLCIILASWLADLSPRTRNGLLVLCSLSLIFVFPMLYGLPYSQSYWNTLFTIFPSWK